LSIEALPADHLIVGGTIKGATSSLFGYLCAHPEVCGSSIKETFFFSHAYTGCREADLARYSRYFDRRPSEKVLVEASPNYLAYKENVAPRIRDLLPDAKLLFVLRDPVDRLYSHFHFAKGKLEVPRDLAFEDYVDRCERYARGELDAKDAAVPEKHLRALEIGHYAKYLENYLALFPERQVKVAFFEHLKRDPVEFMTDVCRFVDIAPEFYRDYVFGRANRTFSAKLRPLHRAAALLNATLEPLLRRRPEIKSRLVSLYKRMNQARDGYEPMASSTRTRLAERYAASNRDLKALLPGRELPAWVG
jgi:hypothetical protein